MLPSRNGPWRLGVWGALFSLALGCGGKEHPPSLQDDTQGRLRDAGVVMSQTMVDGSVEGGSPDAATGPADPLAEQLAKYCIEKPPFDGMLCYATEKGHPANSAVFRNMDSRHGVAWGFTIDAEHRVFDVLANFQGSTWKLQVAAPMGQELVPGSYSTDDNATFSFEWDTGSCPGSQSATFEVFGMSWDDQMPPVPTNAEIDFKHHCGDLGSPTLSAKFRLFSNRPLF